ncbi:MAG: prolipoprotein diacylglyceryl transferase [Roseovarius pacificus]|nr:prolipoprotein diacylglyceryl transferase [Roseovarius pacificus]
MGHLWASSWAGGWASCSFTGPPYYLENPAEALQIWQGGMSFHGGLLGVVTACILFSRRRGIPWLSVADVLCMVTPVGLLLGRIANFINAELWGRPTDLPWGVVFPGALLRRTAPVWPTWASVRAPPLATVRGRAGKGWCWARSCCGWSGSAGR